jgi:hypothetical protein
MLIALSLRYLSAQALVGVALIASRLERAWRAGRRPPDLAEISTPQVCVFRRAIPSLSGKISVRNFRIPSFLVINRLDRAIQ